MDEITHKKGKIYYSMGEVAEMFDVNQSLIRFWESKFDILKPHKNKKGNRMFTPADVDNLKLIYHLVKEKGMTLAGAQKRIKQNKEGIGRDMEIIDRLMKIRSMLMEIREELKTGADEELIEDEDYDVPAIGAMPVTAVDRDATCPESADKPAVAAVGDTEQVAPATLATPAIDTPATVNAGEVTSTFDDKSPARDSIPAEAAPAKPTVSTNDNIEPDEKPDTAWENSEAQEMPVEGFLYDDGEDIAGFDENANAEADNYVEPEAMADEGFTEEEVAEEEYMPRVAHTEQALFEVEQLPTSQLEEEAAIAAEVMEAVAELEKKEQEPPRPQIIEQTLF